VSINEPGNCVIIKERCYLIKNDTLINMPSLLVERWKEGNLNVE
jgi:hypothetical protein